jgi:hypothetical protein
MSPPPAKTCRELWQAVDEKIGYFLGTETIVNTS